ncbi:MAG: heme exporter protein CcmD [Burkholderiales bacterium]
MAEFFAMGGYGWYVWMSYGACALVVVAEAASVRARRRRAIAEARLAVADPPARSGGAGR